MRRKQLQTAKLSNMLHLIRRIPSGTMELLTLLLLMPLLHNATATPGELATMIHIQNCVCVFFSQRCHFICAYKCRPCEI